MSNKARANFLRYTCSGVGIGSLDRRGPANPRPRHRCLPPRLLPPVATAAAVPTPIPARGWRDPALGLLGGPPRAVCLAAPRRLRLTAAVHTRVSPPSPLSCPAARLLLSGDPCPAPLPCCSATHHRAPWLAPFRAGVAGVGRGGRATGTCATAHPAHGEPPPRPAPAMPAPLTGSTTAPFPVCVPSTQPFLTQLEVYRCYLSSSFI